jgi:hypothetical protein
MSSVTNNNGFWFRGLGLLTPSITITLNCNQLSQFSINDPLRLAPFLTGLRVSSLLRDWLGSDLRIGHFFSFRCPLVNIPQLNTQLNSTTELPSEFFYDCWMKNWRLTYDWLITDSITCSSFYNFGKVRISVTISKSSSITACLFVRT